MNLNSGQISTLFKEINSIASESINQLPTLFSETNYWLVRAEGGEFYTDFNINSYIGIGQNEITLDMILNCKGNQDLMKNTLKENLHILNTSEEEITEKQLGTWAGQLLRFYNNIQVNDFVLVPSEGSQTFLVGRISNDVYEVDDKVLEGEQHSNYKKSNYKKRYPVEWIGKFNRDYADPALYKMIYSHTTLTDINEYKPYINRALFPAYIEDDEIHLTFKVSEIDNVESYYLGLFIYQYAKLSSAIDNQNIPDTKINVQSPGFIEMIAESPHAAMIVVILIVLFGGITIVGGEFSGFGIKYKTEGLLKKIQDKKEQKNSDDLKTLNKYKEAVRIAKELKVPISELNIDIPDNLAKILDQKLEDDSDDSNQNSEKTDQDSDDSNQNSEKTDQDSELRE